MNDAQLNNALEKFRELLKEQDERNQRIKAAGAPKDFNSLEKIVIGVCGGDGIGPIITKQSA